ncbi:hypothetical protein K504DRAFT_451470 [Pleomassaria siparia CBS 279.74]|uniref:Uncharacterized protein n=1 Tax=Pleomassaria siparia CBS 279.74 TaxID=1314801 RepID=A0A6G1JTN7_9PLEO|nr:hypothetical protein K504DRAFT_451470 [Pleomassaria siparia CBS 279.74]
MSSLTTAMVAENEVLQNVQINSFADGKAAGNTLLYLPREIRNMIFSYVIRGSQSLHSGLLAHYIHAGEIDSRNWKWLPDMCSVDDLFFCETLPIILQHSIISIDSIYSAYNLRFFLDATQEWGSIRALQFETIDILRPWVAAVGLFKKCVNVRILYIGVIHHQWRKPLWNGSFWESSTSKAPELKEETTCITDQIFELKNLEEVHFCDECFHTEVQEWLREEFEARNLDVETVSHSLLALIKFRGKDGILNRLSIALTDIIARDPTLDPEDYIAGLVREKWGTLKFGMHRVTAEMHETLQKVYDESEKNVTDMDQKKIKFSEMVFGEFRGDRHGKWSYEWSMVGVIRDPVVEADTEARLDENVVREEISDKATGDGASGEGDEGAAKKKMKRKARKEKKKKAGAATEEQISGETAVQDQHCQRKVVFASRKDSTSHIYLAKDDLQIALIDITAGVHGNLSVMNGRGNI